MDKEECIGKAILDLSKRLKDVLSGVVLECKFNWKLSDKTISEIGGRLIEDYVIQGVPEHIHNSPNEQYGRFTACSAATSQRAMEDIFFKWKSLEDEHFEFSLLVDIKGHNETKEGSRPNLASIRKCKELYLDVAKENHELIIFFCRYEPEIIREDNNTTVKYKILDSSFTENAIFLLRYLSDDNLDPADIGSGGQILFAREDNINFTKRTREEFLSFLDKLETHLEKLREEKKKRKK